MNLRSRKLLPLLAVCLLTQLLAGGASAQTDEIEDLRAARDEVRSDRARAAADLDPLLSRNEDIEAALQVLNDDLAAHQASLNTTRTQLDKARSDVAAANQQVLDEQARIADLRVQLQRQAITAYVQPRSESGSDEVFNGASINEGERRRALVLAVSTSQNDILDDLRAAEAGLETAAARAAAAQADIEARQRLEAEQLVGLEQAIGRQQRLQQVLNDRIAEFQAEVDAHAADDDLLTSQITGLIVEEEARQEAIREAARIQAERERVAAEEARIQAERAARIAAGVVPENEAVDRASAGLTGPPSGATISQVGWPVTGVVTSNFGPRWGRQHNGIDIAANTGTPVIAVAAGTVVGAGPSGGFGNLVLVDHGGGLVSAYAHLNSINVSNGQRVSAGNSVGTVGCTGSCTGPHLHFEMRVNGVAYNPMSYLS